MMPPIECPTCKSQEIAVISDPGTGTPLIRADFVLMRCLACDDVFSTDTTMFLACSTSAQDLLIEHDVPCQECGYNLKGLGTDGRCPECGAHVLPAPRVRYVPFHSGMNLWNWLTVALAGCFVALAIVWALVPWTRRPETFIVILAFAAGGYGLKGMLTGQIASTPTWSGDILRGIPCIVCSVAYMVAGFGLLALCLFLFIRGSH
jgi:predicted Zn-ribbon and HTH transcriptional regulator